MMALSAARTVATSASMMVPAISAATSNTTSAPGDSMTTEVTVFAPGVSANFPALLLQAAIASRMVESA
jgi:hypothetical protein